MQQLAYFKSSFLSSKRFRLLVLLWLGITSVVFAQFDIPKKPEFQTSVYDYVNLLSSAEKKQLEQKLIKYSDTTSTQIVLAIISSTKGENINYLGANWGQAWGIGQAKEDNGILILLAKDDRRIAINTGYGVEHLLTDALSKRIIERNIIPYFKKNDYPGGLNSGIDAIFQVLNGEYKGSRKSKKEEPPLGFIIFLIIIFFIILISISKNKRGGGGKGGHRLDSRDLFDAIILSNMGRGNYRRGGTSGWGGSSGGGFGGGFGGGGFGGGGASGGW
ncbi:TPM domain-containing protein [Tamlana fucoidanivorans]|uniref:TPM domain-containing protein n=1 Tax=Allotamlana fucoidanivorans TaxID=2583814 RepID=A0A5C4SHS6_9FLAO|nr:TPM domain-containing protein [Tamlana fucoidanivorans]TNJ42577.1 TPM domain-containing protein [Tamlana fucoidanivorans]